MVLSCQTLRFPRLSVNSHQPNRLLRQAGSKQFLLSLERNNAVMATTGVLTLPLTFSTTFGWLRGCLPANASQTGWEILDRRFNFPTAVGSSLQECKNHLDFPLISTAFIIRQLFHRVFEYIYDRSIKKDNKFVHAMNHGCWIHPERCYAVDKFENLTVCINFTGQTGAFDSRLRIDNDLKSATGALASDILTLWLPSPLLHCPHTKTK